MKIQRLIPAILIVSTAFTMGLGIPHDRSSNEPTLTLQEQCFDCWHESKRNKHFCSLNSEDLWQGGYHSEFADSTCEAHGHNDCQVVEQELLAVVQTIEDGSASELRTLLALFAERCRYNRERGAIQIYSTCNLQATVVAHVPLTEQQILGLSSEKREG